MTVSELIAALQGMPQDAEVMVRGQDIVKPVAFGFGKLHREPGGVNQVIAVVAGHSALLGKMVVIE